MSFYNTEILALHPKAYPECTVCGDKYRFTVITDRLIRMEYSEDCVFEDRATRLATNRAFDKPDFDVYEDDGNLHIVTKHLHLKYDKAPFSAAGLQIVVNGTKNWEYGAKKDNLGGTARTLDRADGEIPLDDGLLSRKFGYAVVDDSKTIVFDENGYPAPLCKNGRIDIYFFGYGHEYAECIRDFYKFSSPMPLIPRYALGNWWSRYHAYTADEYLKLMNDFEEKRIPLSVAVIDMDWHLTKTPDETKYGDGWTGYTWDKKLFPDRKAFLASLHKKGLHTTLNLHPRDGIRDYEDGYNALATALGKDPSLGKTIDFDVADRRFMEEYFNTILHSLEKDGVDFWWIDWQQSGGSSVAGYDVLWMLNHCHFIDNAAADRRPMTLSRYAGIGSHRYPLGFSGDTYVTWKSLAFQPYFTACAANVGFSYWSHDIGGHMGGYHDGELYTRWVQFGVFSPVMRLHSSPNPFNSKEPWNYGVEAERISTDFLRLRHKLIPYLYSMVYRNNECGIPTFRPMYHDYPNAGSAYTCKNEYLFGDCLIVAPITVPCDRESMLAKTKVWLPDGVYIDFFSGLIYRGNRTTDFYCSLSEMPVFVKAGTILPLSDDFEGNTTENPSSLTLKVYGGADGQRVLIEDNGKNGDALITTRTEYTFTFGEKSELAFTAAAGEGVPDKRDYTICFCAFGKPDAITADINGNTQPLEFEYDDLKNEVTARLDGINAGDSVCVTVSGNGELPENEISRNAFRILAAAQADHGMKETLYNLVRKNAPTSVKIQEMLCGGYDASIVGALVELLCAN